MRLPPVVLVTGTDTGVGKTVVTAALAACLVPTCRVGVFKPAQTGIDAGDPGDIDEVRRLAGAEYVHEGVRLRDPLAPTTAARRQGITPPTVAEHAAAIAKLAAERDHVLVEGAGGLLVGLDAGGNNLADLAGHLSGPYGFVVVVRSGLGTLNHTGLTVEALRARRLPVIGLVIGSWPDEPDLAEECNLTDLPSATGVPIIGRLPSGAVNLTPATFQSSAPTWLSIE